MYCLGFPVCPLVNCLVVDCPSGDMTGCESSCGMIPIQQGIQYKINTLYINVSRPYLCDCFQLYTPSRTLRSASDTLSLQIPRTRLSAVGSRAFSVFCPPTWNDLPLPLPLRQKLSLESFKDNLKTPLFPNLQTCHVFRSVLLSSSVSSLCLLPGLIW